MADTSCIRPIVGDQGVACGHDVVLKMTAGSGWDYLIRNTVNADRDRSSVEKLTEYFLGSGVPAGVWMNMGADTQSVSGAVSQTQMAALFGNGWDPNAQQVIVGQLAGVGSHGARMAAAGRH